MTSPDVRTWISSHFAEEISVYMYSKNGFANCLNVSNAFTIVKVKSSANQFTHISNLYGGLYSVNNV